MWSETAGVDLKEKVTVIYGLNLKHLCDKTGSYGKNKSTALVGLTYLQRSVSMKDVYMEIYV